MRITNHRFTRIYIGGLIAYDSRTENEVDKSTRSLDQCLYVVVPTVVVVALHFLRSVVLLVFVSKRRYGEGCSGEEINFCERRAVARSLQAPLLQAVSQSVSQSVKDRADVRHGRNEECQQ